MTISLKFHRMHGVHYVFIISYLVPNFPPPLQKKKTFKQCFSVRWFGLCLVCVAAMGPIQCHWASKRCHALGSGGLEREEVFSKSPGFWGWRCLFFPPFFAAPPSCRVSFLGVFLVALNVLFFLCFDEYYREFAWLMFGRHRPHIVMLEFEKLSSNKNHRLMSLTWCIATAWSKGV